MGVRRRTEGERLRTPAAVPIDSRRFPAPGPTHQQRDVSPGGWLGSGLVRLGVERLGALDVRQAPGAAGSPGGETRQVHARARTAPGDAVSACAPTFYEWDKSPAAGAGPTRARNKGDTHEHRPNGCAASGQQRPHLSG